MTDLTGKNVAVLLSGGVDSSVVVHLLCEQGLRPALFYIRIGIEGDGYSECSTEEDLEICHSVARHYGLTLDTVDLHREYREQVIEYVIDRARRGLTPNPDVMCNRLIKFGCFEQSVGHLFDYTATGHYATTLRQDGLTWLATARDPVKDQTDFLAGIDQLQVAHLLFPIGELMKSEVRGIAAKAGLLAAQRRDSQGICFLGQVPYNDFIRHFLGEREGKVIELETGRVIGKHRGHWFHTIGQRKGLGFGAGPWFVIRKDPQRNIVYVSHGWGTEKQYGDHFRMLGFHFVAGDPWAANAQDVEVSFKIRHTPEFTQGWLTREGSTFSIRSAKPLQGIAPGQFGVLYSPDHRLCYGSGEIVSGEE